MNAKRFSRSLAFLLLAALTGGARAQDDDRVVGYFDQTGPHERLRTISIYINLNGNEAPGLPALPAANETRFYSKVWEGLYLQVLTETGEGQITGYMLGFSKDEGNHESLDPEASDKNAPLREISASDFRTDDNYGPSPVHGGWATLDDPGPFRVIHYPGFDLEIRVLELHIGNAALQKKPYFKNLSLLVTVKETGSKKKAD